MQQCIEVRLTLLGAYRLFGTMHKLAGHIVPMDCLWGRSAARLTEQLVVADSWERRFDLLDRALGEALSAGPEPDPEIDYAWNRLYNAAGEVVIGDLVTETGWSRGRLAERFRAQTGLTPKAAATMLRFHRAVRLIAQECRPPLSSVALSCGYYDQAHLNRDFRLLAGCTPTEWIHAQFTDLLGAGCTPGDG